MLVSLVLVLLGEAASSLVQKTSSSTVEEYCRIHQNHTMCLYQGLVSTGCGELLERGLTPEERVLVTRLHNQRRSFLAQGLEKRGDPGPQPSAANMMQLTYDEELELEAQTWTDQCVRGHDCPDCRTLPRFKVGQNLFWYGHFVGSWEKSVAGWYDEVVDFNSSFVYPFYVIPGVLVGHFTQMSWAQTTKLGCGKLYAQPADSELGQQFFICNYGLAGNLIKSQMYQPGRPCSACPGGTKCSADYPGLCEGVPHETLTVRPPIYDHIDFPTHGSRPSRPDGEIQILPPILVAPPMPPPDARDECVYTCETDGGCSVKIASYSFVSGSVGGSCFPPSFGGKCSGTPAKCRECKGECRGKEGMLLTVELDKAGKPTAPKISRLDDLPSPTDDSTSSGRNGGGDTCSYNCQPVGGCSVRINTKSFVSGSVQGSCFSKAFGGKCGGTPKGCKECLGVCEEKGEEGGEVILPVIAG